MLPEMTENRPKTRLGQSMPRCQLQAFPGPNAELSIQASRSPESHPDALTIPVICVFKPPPSNALASCRRRPLKTWSPVAKPAALSCRGTAIPHRTGTAGDRTRFVPARETKLGDAHDCRGRRLVPDRQKSTVDTARVALSPPWLCLRRRRATGAPATACGRRYAPATGQTAMRHSAPTAA